MGTTTGCARFSVSNKMHELFLAYAACRPSKREKFFRPAGGFELDSHLFVVHKHSASIANLKHFTLIPKNQSCYSCDVAFLSGRIGNGKWYASGMCASGFWLETSAGEKKRSHKLMTPTGVGGLLRVTVLLR